MGKNIKVRQSDSSELKLNNIVKIRTELQAGGTCDWVPEDDVHLIDKTVTESGTYTAANDNAYGYSAVTVNVPQSSTQPNLQSKTATQNGTVTPDSGYDGLSSVVVDVGGEGADSESFALKNYIQATGTQWIDTGYIVKDNSRFDIVFAPAASPQKFATLIGVRDNDDRGSPSSARRCTLFITHTGSSSSMYAWGTNDTALELPTPMYLKTLKQRLVFSKGYVYIAQSNNCKLAYGFTPSASASSTNSLYLLTLNQAGEDYGTTTHCSGKLYRMRVYEGDALVMELLPANNNGTVCLRDSVSGRYLYNNGSGSFTYGTDS